MKKHYLWVFILLWTTLIYGQEWEQIVVSENESGNLMKPFDLDQDGDVDLLVKNQDLVWYENLDGTGNFDNPQSLASNISSMLGFELFDLDGDQDMDILYYTSQNQIFWIENLNGFGDFGPSQEIYSGEYVYDVKAVDVDQDDDLDIVAILGYDVVEEQLVWMENSDGNGTFLGEVQLSTGSFHDCGCLFVMDVDGDQLNDLVTVIWSGPTRFVYYRNNPDGSLEPEQIVYQFQLVQSDWTHIYHPGVADLDGDAVNDIYFISQYDDQPTYLQWLHHYNGQGGFTDPHTIQNLGYGHNNFVNITHDDLDGDSLVDLLYVVNDESAQTELSWFQNIEGGLEFEEPRLISTQFESIRKIAIADLNSDGHPDPISLSIGDDKLAWYANPGNLGTENFSVNEFEFYPNPAQDKVFLDTTLPISKIRLVNASGQTMDIDLVQGSMNVSALARGIYLLEVTFDNGQTQVQRLLIR